MEFVDKKDLEDIDGEEREETIENTMRKLFLKRKGKVWGWPLGYPQNADISLVWLYSFVSLIFSLLLLFFLLFNY